MREREIREEGEREERERWRASVAEWQILIAD